MLLDNVKILEKNSCNRDVRVMRTNGLTFRIADPQIVAVIEEGYKIYNADGVLQQEVPDRAVEAEEYAKLCKDLEDAMIYKLEKKGDSYRISIDGEEHGEKINWYDSYDNLIAEKKNYHGDSGGGYGRQ